MSTHAGIQEIRTALWEIIWDLKCGEMDPECAEQMISAMDSLLDACRLENEQAASTKTGPQASLANQDRSSRKEDVGRRD